MPGETVTVASKLPFGLVIQACEMVTKYDDGGKREIKEARRLPGQFIINGVGIPPKARRENLPLIRDGYALTLNVPADLWNAWFQDNKTSDCIVNKVVFAMPKVVDAEAQAKNNAKAVRSGLEPLNPEKIIKNGLRVPADPRIPHVIDPSDGVMG